MLSLIGFFAHFVMTKERVPLPPDQKQENHSLKYSLKALLKNKPFLALCMVSMLLIAFQMYTQTTYNYLLKDFYQRPELYSLVTVFTYLPMALFLPFLSRLIKKFGKKELCSAGLLFSAVINIIMYLIGFTPAAANPYLFLVLLFFSGFPDASVLHHRQLYAQSDRAKVDAAIAEKGIPAGERYILVGMQDGGRAYYIFQYLLDPAFLSLNLEDWRQADAILIYDPKPLELVYIEQTILPSGEAPVIYDCR